MSKATVDELRTCLQRVTTALTEKYSKPQAMYVSWSSSSFKEEERNCGVNNIPIKVAMEILVLLQQEYKRLLLEELVVLQKELEL